MAFRRSRVRSASAPPIKSRLFRFTLKHISNCLRFCRGRRYVTSLSAARVSVSVVTMRTLACLLTALVALLQVAGNGSLCFRFEMISTDCCSTNCPAAPAQAGRNCCQISESQASLQPAVSTTDESMPFDLVSAARPVLITNATAVRSRYRRLDPRARSSPLSLFCSRQI